MDGIAPGHHHAGEGYWFTDLQAADGFIADGNGYFAHYFLSFHVSLRGTKVTKQSPVFMSLEIATPTTGLVMT
jgi:hypothetical protein